MCHVLSLVSLWLLASINQEPVDPILSTQHTALTEIQKKTRTAESMLEYTKTIPNGREVMGHWLGIRKHPDDIVLLARCIRGTQSEFDWDSWILQWEFPDPVGRIILRNRPRWSSFFRSIVENSIEGKVSPFTTRGTRLCEILRILIQYGTKEDIAAAIGTLVEHLNDLSPAELATCVFGARVAGESPSHDKAAAVLERMAARVGPEEFFELAAISLSPRLVPLALRRLDDSALPSHLGIKSLQLITFRWDLESSDAWRSWGKSHDKIFDRLDLLAEAIRGPLAVKRLKRCYSQNVYFDPELVRALGRVTEVPQDFSVLLGHYSPSFHDDYVRLATHCSRDNVTVAGVNAIIMGERLPDWDHYVVTRIEQLMKASRLIRP